MFTVRTGESSNAHAPKAKSPPTQKIKPKYVRGLTFRTTSRVVATVRTTSYRGIHRLVSAIARIPVGDKRTTRYVGRPRRHCHHLDSR